VVQKVQPNDKSGKLLRNNHTKGRKRAPGHLMSKGLRAASRQTKGSRGSLARFRAHPHTERNRFAGSAPDSPRARESRSLTCHKVVIPWRADAMCVEGVAVKLLSLE